MADYYLDHGAYASQLGAVPTWGAPQEGDGSASTAASTAGTVSVDLTATSSTAGTVSIFGSGAIAFAASSGSALAANIAAAINASTLTNTVHSAIVGAPQVRNLVYARATGATLEVMCRVGSSLLNTLGVVFGGTWSANQPGNLTFSGGVGGCWGWFINQAAIGVSSSISARVYGLFAAKPMVSASAFSEYDLINVRTGRNASIAISSASFGATANRMQYANFVFDDGAVWSGDSQSGKLTIDWSGFSIYVTWSEANQYTTVRCKQLGGLTINMTCTANQPMYLSYPGAGGASWGFHLEKVAIIEQNSAYQTSYPIFYNASYPSRFEASLVGCRLDFSATQRTNIINPLFSLPNNTNTQATYTFSLIGNDIRYALTGVGAAAASIPLFQLSSANGPNAIVARGNVFTTGASVDLALLSLAGYAAGIGLTLVAENNIGAGLPVGPIGITPTFNNPDTAGIVLDNLAVGGAAKYETRSGYCEFKPGQPVFSSVSPDGTLWSWLVYWTNATQVITPGRPFKLPASRIQSRLASGVRSWSLELLLDSVSLAQMPTHGVVEVEYVNTSGIPVCERNRVVLAASTASWANTGAGPYNTWVAKKISGATAQAVPINSILNIRLLLERSLSGGSTASFMLNPEASIA